MRVITILIVLSLCLSSCFLFSKYKRTTFTYNKENQSYSIPIVVPKGYIKERTEVDSSGNTILSYTYDSGALFYIAHLEDTTTQLQPIAEKDNIPRVALNTGAVIYKGLDSTHLFWREIQQNNFRVGYRFVPKELEHRFDSATNYAVVHPLK